MQHPALSHVNGRGDARLRATALCTLFLATHFLISGCTHPVTTDVTPPHPTVSHGGAVPGHIVPDRFVWKPTRYLLERGSTATGYVALTFDAGSDASAVPALLKTLVARHVHSTFFLTGKFCERYPDACRAIAAAGMELGNHSYSHPHLTRLSAARVREQLVRAEAEIVRVCGRSAKPLFRFPYGDTNTAVCSLVAGEGYQPIGWSLDSLDAVGKPKSAAFVKNRIESRIRPGVITLMHVSCKGSAEAVPAILDYLGRLHLQPVTVSELMQATRVATKTNHSPHRTARHNRDVRQTA